MKIADLKWMPSCCGWAYAEVSKGSSALRIKRKGAEYLVVRFGDGAAPIDADGDGIPEYQSVTETDLESLLVSY